MKKYIFILGNNPEISQAEILAVLPGIKIIKQNNTFFVGENDDIDCEQIITILGGTIKIGLVIDKKIDQGLVFDEIKSHYQSQKVKFGFSFYGVKQDKTIGFEIKKKLKQDGINSRLVTSREKFLSAVIVKKEKVLDFLVLPNYFGVTCSVQKFEEYGERDFGRPRVDAHSGMLPPKLARMMINLTQSNKEEVVLDPFCGSGTILGELLSLGYKDIVGCDKSSKAVDNSQENSAWLENKLDNENSKFNIFQCEVEKISEKIENKSVSAIVTEPHLGPPMLGGEKIKQVEKIKLELEDLYLLAFEEFKKILKANSRVVMIWPQWHIKDRVIDLNIESQIEGLGFERLDQNNLLYKRDGQRVWRRILIWRK